MNVSDGLSFGDHFFFQRNQVLTEENFYLPNGEARTMRCLYRTMKLGSLTSYSLASTHQPSRTVFSHFSTHEIHLEVLLK